ncbi:hypothetical protein ACHAXS_012606 [Conticribra weissflogii]
MRRSLLLLLNPTHPNGRIIQQRHFSSCPFQTLGLEKPKFKSNRHESSISYEDVRVAFRKLALQHHPDMVVAKRRKDEGGQKDYNPVEMKRSSLEFTKIREAFEAIVEGPNGVAILRDGCHDSSYGMERGGRDRDKNDDSNFHHEEIYGFLHKSVNPRVLHEVAEVAATMNPGGLDRGGMWQYANMIRNMAECDGKGLPPLQVGGRIDPGSQQPVGRRRKRK